MARDEANDREIENHNRDSISRSSRSEADMTLLASAPGQSRPDEAPLRGLRALFAWRPDLQRFAIYCWIPFSLLAYLIDLSRQTSINLTNGVGRSFGDDFINFWSAPVLAWRGRVAEVYDFHAFHVFQQSVLGRTLDLYHYSYPPVTILLTAPLAAMPYLLGYVFWIAGSWGCFYAALRLAKPSNALILALATPAVFVNAFAGQNGAWTAALLGGGLCLLERRPIMAGVLFGLMASKPQLAVLIPVALLAGRQWRALAAASVTVIALTSATFLIFGPEIWVQYLHRAQVLKVAILEGDGTDILWRRMLSVFIFAHRLGFDVATSYALQAVSGLLAAAVVVIAWARNAPARLRYALLLLGTCLATPYLQDYDFVFSAFLVAWLVRSDDPRQSPSPMVVIALGLVLAAPLFESGLSKLTGLGLGPLFTATAFIVVARMALRPAEARRPQIAPGSPLGPDEETPLPSAVS